MRRHSTRAASAALIAMLALPAVAGAQSPVPPQFSITVNREPIVQGQPFELVIAVATESAGDPEVRLPQFRGLRVIRQSESHPMSFSFSFGFGGQTQRQTKRTSNYSFVLVADRPGAYALDPVLVTIDGRQFKSDPVTLKVLDSQAALSAGTPGPSGPDPGAGSPAPDPGSGFGAAPLPDAERSLDAEALAGAVVDPQCFVQLELSRTEAVIGELVVLTVWLYTSSRVSDVEVVREPGTEGFWVETLLAGQRRLAFEPVLVGGRPYERGVLRKLALFPIEAGTLSVSPVMVNVETRRGGLFSRSNTVKRASPAVKIAVAGLPEEGQPTGFDPANVGRFSYRVEADRAEVEIGEPVTLTISVSGEGNLRNVNLPQLSEVDGFKVYPPENEVNLRPSEQNVVGTRISRVLMIPKRHGTLTVPDIPWSFFDPAAGEYHTVRSPRIAIAVKPGDQSAEAGTNVDPVTSVAMPADPGGAFERLARRLRSIESRAALEPDGLAPTVTRPWYLAAVLAAPLTYLAVLLGSRARRRATESRNRDRSRRANAVARKELAGLRKQLEQLPATNFFGELQRVLARFLESRLEAAIAGDTMDELRRRLCRRGFAAGLAERVVAELECCDFARFARSAGDAGERRAGLERMQALIDELAAVAVTRPEEEERR
jgi:hypothetical protein